jgi:hypothetical protein
MTTTTTKAATKAKDDAARIATMRLSYLSGAGETASPVRVETDAVRLHSPVTIEAIESGVSFTTATGERATMTWTHLAELVASGSLEERRYGVVVAGRLSAVVSSLHRAYTEAMEAREGGATADVIEVPNGVA